MKIDRGRRRRYHFFDSDALVEQAAGKSVAAIFAEDGEADFREAESSVMQVRCLHRATHDGQSARGRNRTRLGLNSCA